MPKSPKEYLKEPYSRILIPDEGSFAAEILEFPGCFAEGETPNEAFANLEEAAESWIETALEEGLEIPEPFMNQGYGGKIALRLPRSIHRQAVRIAERDNVSLNQFLVSAISARIGAEDLYSRILNELNSRILNQLNSHILDRFILTGSMLKLTGAMLKDVRFYNSTPTEVRYLKETATSPNTNDISIFHPQIKI